MSIIKEGDKVFFDLVANELKLFKRIILILYRYLHVFFANIIVIADNKVHILNIVIGLL